MALGIYNLGPPVGAALGIAFRASIAAAFSWREAFVAIGVVGLLVAVATPLLVKEPARGGLDQAVGAPPPERAPFWGTVRMFFSRPTLVLAVATMLTVFGSPSVAVSASATSAVDSNGV